MKILEIYLFSAVINNKKNNKPYSGYGIFVTNPEQYTKISRPYFEKTDRKVTAPRIDQYLIYKILNFCEKLQFFQDYDKVFIYTCSLNAILTYERWCEKWSNSGWSKSKRIKEIKNVDIIKKTYPLYLKNVDKIEFKHVHYNNFDSPDQEEINLLRAKKLAYDGARKNRQLIKTDSEKTQQ